MRKIIGGFLMLGSVTAKAQVSTEHFKFNCACTLQSQDYNPSKHSYSYDIMSSNGHIAYNISLIKISMSKSDALAYFKVIKSSSPLKYEDGLFQSNSSIIAISEMNGLFMKHVAFVKNGFGIGILIISETAKELDSAYNDLNRNFSFK